jgi:hypothetical protein
MHVPIMSFDYRPLYILLYIYRCSDVIRVDLSLLKKIIALNRTENVIGCAVSKRITSKCFENLLITETFETPTIRTHYRETSARIVVVVSCLFVI